VVLARLRRSSGIVLGDGLLGRRAVASFDFAADDAAEDGLLGGDKDVALPGAGARFLDGIGERPFMCDDTLRVGLVRQFPEILCELVDQLRVLSHLLVEERQFGNIRTFGVTGSSGTARKDQDRQPKERDEQVLWLHGADC
jgi:hypothetical protein